MTSPTLSEFYHGKTILLTGSTGFLGKVILEKILRSLASVQTVYLSITPRVSTDKVVILLFFRLTKESKVNSYVFSRRSLLVRYGTD
jgi:hypothetical protein